jgi:hypothetical protein
MVVRVTFPLRFDPCGDIAPAELLGGRTDPLQEDKAAYVVDDARRDRDLPALEGKAELFAH